MRLARCTENFGVGAIPAILVVVATLLAVASVIAVAVVAAAVCLISVFRHPLADGVISCLPLLVVSRERWIIVYDL